MKCYSNIKFECVDASGLKGERGDIGAFGEVGEQGEEGKEKFNTAQISRAGSLFNGCKN